MSIWQLFVYFIIELYVVFSSLYCCKKLNENYVSPSSKLNIFLIYIIFAFILLINNIYNTNEYKIMMSFVIMVFMNCLYYKQKTKTVIIDIMIYTMVSVILELLFSPFLSSFNNIDSFNNDGFFIKIIYTLFILSLSNLCFKLRRVNLFLLKIKKFTIKLFKLEVLLIFILLTLNIMTFTLGQRMNNLTFIFSMIIATLYIIITTIILTKNQSNIEKLKSKNKELFNSYKAYSVAFDQFREMKHNLKHDLSSIRPYLSVDKQSLLTNIIKKYNVEYQWLNTLDTIPEGLEGIIYLKKNEADKNKVNFIINYNCALKIKDKDFLDICDILGIMMDNAIEASSVLEKKGIVYLSAYDVGNKIYISIKNNFKNIIDMNRIGTKDYSTKNRKSGIGMYYIEKNNNPNIKTKFEIINNLFVSTIIYTTKK